MKFPFENSRWVWVEDEAPRRNQFVRFTRTFKHEAGDAGPFWLYLFADTRYRLWVNDRFVATGPGRFVTQHAEYDSHDISEHLKEGPNRICVEVNYYGANSFQTMPDGEPGFIAAGGHRGVDLATPGHWKAERLDAWRVDAPLFSFAQGPVEICDTRRLKEGKPVSIIELSPDACPWGELEPFSGTPLPFDRVNPKSIPWIGPLRSDERRVGFMAHDPSANRPQTGEKVQRPWIGFATWIYAPEATTESWSCFWSDLTLNGQPVEKTLSKLQGNHARVKLELNEGWNLLTGLVEVLTEYWMYALGVPEGSDVSLHASMDLEEPHCLAISPVAPRDSVYLPLVGAEAPPLEWQLIDGNPEHLTPGRMVAWDLPAENVRRDLDYGELPQVEFEDSAEFSAVFTFSGEFHGHLVVEVEAPAGTTLDIACDDWQRDDGAPALYRSNPFTDATDRFILKGGRQKVELFHARGGKVVQVVLRAPGDKPAALRVHDLYVRSRLIWRERMPAFSCDDPVMEWAWPVSIRTLTHSTDDAYADCPWRERGSYIGDSLVNLHLSFLIATDLRTAKRTFRNFALAQLPSGHLPACAPAWLRRPHEDFTLMWVLAIRDWWAYTGDLDLIRQMWPHLERIWASSDWESHESGLWNLQKRHAFFDWGILPAEREGVGHAGINILRVAAARATAELAEQLGHDEEASRFRDEADQVEATLESLLFDREAGRLRPSLDAETPALHFSALAFGLSVGTSGMRETILKTIEPELRRNLALGLEKGQHAGQLELFFFSFLLPALAEHGRADLAEELIRDHWGYLMELGDDTLPECFSRVERGQGSRCHSWSGAPAIYAARYVLGLRLEHPGNPNHFIFDPRVAEITRASGTLPHPKGAIQIHWERVNGELKAETTAPEGVTIRQV